MAWITTYPPSACLLFHGDDFERGSVGVGAKEEDQVVAFGGWVEWADAVFHDVPRSLVTDPMSRCRVSEDDKHPMSPLCRTQHRCQEWSAEIVGGQPGAVFRMISSLEPRSREFVARHGDEPAPLLSEPTPCSFVRMAGPLSQRSRRTGYPCSITWLSPADRGPYRERRDPDDECGDFVALAGTGAHHGPCPLSRPSRRASRRAGTGRRRVARTSQGS
jgi:hypothetical protein